MKTLLLALTLTFLASAAFAKKEVTIRRASLTDARLLEGNFNYCRMTDGGMLCDMPKNAKTLAAPSVWGDSSASIALTDQYLCVLSGGAVSCQGDDFKLEYDHEKQQYKPNWYVDLVKKLTNVTWLGVLETTEKNHWGDIEPAAKVCWRDDRGFGCIASDEWNREQKKYSSLRTFLNRDLDNCLVTYDRELKCGVKPSVDNIDEGRFIRVPVEHSYGKGFQCAIDGSGVICWGDEGSERVYDVPKDLKNPRQLVSGDTHSCVISEGKIRCWGNWEHQTKVPEGIKNPVKLVAAADYTCALDDEGVKCWGATTRQPSIGTFDKVPGIGRPKNITAYGDTICTIGDKVFCWKKDSSGGSVQSVTENLPKRTGSLGPKCKNSDDVEICRNGERFRLTWNNRFDLPEQFVAGENHVCFLKNGKVICEGDNSKAQLNVPRDLKDVSSLSAGRNHTCALANQQVRCWGDFNDGFEKLLNPVQVIAYRGSVCVVGDKVVGDADQKPARGMQCSGGWFNDFYAFAGLSRVSISSEGHFCFSDDKQLKCYGEDSKEWMLKPAPKDFFAYEEFSCGNVKGEVWSCFGKTPFSQRDFPYGRYPTYQSNLACHLQVKALVMSLDCAPAEESDRDGMTYMRKPVLLTGGAPRFFQGLNSLAEDLSLAAKHLSPLYARVMNSLATVAGTAKTDEERFAIAKMAREVLRTFDSQNAREDLLPALQRILKTPKSSPNDKRIYFLTLRLSLESSVKILPAGSRAAAETMIASLRKLESSGFASAEGLATRQVLQANHRVLKAFAGSEMTDFLFQLTTMCLTQVGVQ